MRLRVAALPASLALGEQHPVGQVGQLAHPRLARSDRGGQQVEALALERGIGIRVLGEQPGRVRPVGADQGSSRPAVRGDHAFKPGQVLAVRLPHRVRVKRLPRDLVLLHPAQQLRAQPVIHVPTLIPRDPRLQPRKPVFRPPAVTVAHGADPRSNAQEPKEPLRLVMAFVLPGQTPYEGTVALALENLSSWSLTGWRRSSLTSAL